MGGIIDSTVRRLKLQASPSFTCEKCGDASHPSTRCPRRIKKPSELGITSNGDLALYEFLQLLEDGPEWDLAKYTQDAMGLKKFLDDVDAKAEYFNVRLDEFAAGKGMSRDDLLPDTCTFSRWKAKLAHWWALRSATSF